MPDNSYQDARARRLTAALTLLAVLVPLGYALVTDHRWEDFYITYRNSRNLVEGRGMHFHEDARVHSFTSPIGTLVPALFLRISGSDEAALWMFRMLGILMFAAGWLAFASCIRRGGGPVAPILAMSGLLLALDAKAACFTVNGMETGVMLGFSALAFRAAFLGIGRHWLAAGLSWTGLMWTRPDGCLYILFFTLASLVFANEPRREILRGCLKAGLVCTVLYLPWFAGATWYYGSPVPQSIRAKAPLYPFAHFKGLIKNAWWLPWQRLAGCFTGTYADLGGWPAWTWIEARLLAGFCAFWFLVPSSDRLGRMASLAFCLFGFYLGYIIPFPWYYPPVTALGLLVLGRAFLLLAARFPPGALARRAAWTLNGIMLAGSLYFLCVNTLAMKIRYEEVDAGNLKRIGLWLKNHISPGERAFFEPLGTISYFSGARVINFPGLCSPEVTEIVRARKLPLREGGYAQVIPIFKPDWLIMRPGKESEALALPEVRENYQWVTTFDVREQVLRRRSPVGADYLLCDAVFKVYRRIKPGTASDPGG